MFKMIFAAAIWIPYMLLSKRVKVDVLRRTGSVMTAPDQEQVWHGHVNTHQAHVIGMVRSKMPCSCSLAQLRFSYCDVELKLDVDGNARN